MASLEQVLAVDIGATGIKVGEFEYLANGEIFLTGFAFREYEDELTESSRSIVIAGMLRQVIEENQFSSKKALISISGQSIFTRFVKLPPVADDEEQIKEIVKFEARQNVPFPMDEVVWDYQLVANPENEDLNVMFIVVKNEIVEELTRAVQEIGIEPLLVDVAPAACYNAARANHIGDEECTMILNIGGKSTNLLFADKQRFFARTIPIAGHSITQQIGKEFGIGLAEAEELKRRHGFVSLGGAYAEPESEVASAISKIIRNVMARLHSEINRSISVYRAQQKGNRPVRLYLTGGSSTMMYTDHFFAEKLRMEVEYMNPFKVVKLGSGINLTRLEEVAHMFSEVVGLGLRYKVACPIEVSLIPASIRSQQELKKKKPLLCVAAIVVVLMFALVYGALNRKGVIYVEKLDKISNNYNTYKNLTTQISTISGEIEVNKEEVNNLKNILQGGSDFANLINNINDALPSGVWTYGFGALYGDFEFKSEETDDGGFAQNGPGPGAGAGGFDALPGGGGGFGSGDSTIIEASEYTIGALELIGNAAEINVVKKQYLIEKLLKSIAEKLTENVEGEEKLIAENELSDEKRELLKKISERLTSRSTIIDYLCAKLTFENYITEARLVKYKPSSDIVNLSAFTIKIKLKKPIAGYRVTGKVLYSSGKSDNTATRSGSSGGSMPSGDFKPPMM